MRYCKDCELYECALRTPFGGCDEDHTLYIANPASIEYISPIDWERFRAETARMVLAAIVAKDDCRMTTRDNDVKYAVAYADELIRQLKDDNN